MSEISAELTCKRPSDWLTVWLAVRMPADMLMVELPFHFNEEVEWESQLIKVEE